MRRSLLLPLLLAACAIPEPKLAPILFEPDSYRQMYADLEKCSGLKGDFGGLAWYSTESRRHKGNTFDAYWQPGGIVVRQGKMEDMELIRHEMMHDLIRSGTHPRKYFKGVCGDISLGDKVS